MLRAGCMYHLGRFGFGGLQPLQPRVVMTSGCMWISLVETISRVGKCAGQGEGFANSWSFYLFMAQDCKYICAV